MTGRHEKVRNREKKRVVSLQESHALASRIIFLFGNMVKTRGQQEAEKQQENEPAKKPPASKKSNRKPAPAKASPAP